VFFFFFFFFFFFLRRFAKSVIPVFLKGVTLDVYRLDYSAKENISFKIDQILLFHGT